MKDSYKPWGGRFQQPINEFVEEFTASINFDKRLYKYDIQGSIAHAKMLAKIAVLTQAEMETIVNGLQEVEKKLDEGSLVWSVALEDVHMNIETMLIAEVGEVGKKLHTARSRNDQVATDLRLYLRAGIDNILELCEKLQLGLLELAKEHTQTIMPGFTHLQVAQPISFAHHLMAWYEMLCRDVARLVDARHRLNILPLGSAALAGTTYPIDREYVADLLGFDGVANNSLDAVSDRDFCIEFVSAAAVLMMHLSRWCEELILWNSQQFSFVSLPDSFCTGSSIMPQKKNPDVPELVRGKTGRVYGHLNSLLVLMKSQPLAYNKDNQEDKEPVFDTVDTLQACLYVFAQMLPHIKANKDKMLAAANLGYATATDLADYLVKKGMPFRDAHEVVGKAVSWCETHDKTLAEAPLASLQQFSDLIEDDVYQVLQLSGSLNARDHIGATAAGQVMEQIEQAIEDLSYPVIDSSL